MSEQEMSEITTIPTISSESFSTTAEDVAPFIQSNLNVEPFLKLKRMVEEFVDVGEGEGKCGCGSGGGGRFISRKY